MAMDSATSLLFKIGANADDAQENIARFRTVFGKDMGELKQEVSGWAEEVFGSSEKVKEAYAQQVAAIQKEKAAMLKNAATAEETSRIETEAAEKAARAQSHLKSALQNVGLGWKSLGAVAGASVAGLGATLFESAKKSAELGEQMENLHDETGMSTEMLSTLRVMSKEAGIGFDQMAITAETLARNTSDLVRPTSMAARAAKELGIQTKNADGSAKSADQIFIELADALHKSGINARTTALATSILSTSGAKLIPILVGGKQAIDDAAVKTREMGQMVTETSAKMSTEFLASVRDMNLQLEGLIQTIGLKVMPAMTVTLKGAVATAQGAFNAFDDVIGFVSKHSGAIIQVFEAASAVLTTYAAKMVAARLATLDFSAATIKALIVETFEAAMTAASTAIEAATTALKGFTLQEGIATGGLILLVGAVYKAIDAYRQMREAQDGAKAAEQNLQKVTKDTDRLMEAKIKAVEQVSHRTAEGATILQRAESAQKIFNALTAKQRDEVMRLDRAFLDEAQSAGTATEAVTKHGRAARHAADGVHALKSATDEYSQDMYRVGLAQEQVVRPTLIAAAALQQAQLGWGRLQTQANASMQSIVASAATMGLTVPRAFVLAENSANTLRLAFAQLSRASSMAFDLMSMSGSKYARVFMKLSSQLIRALEEQLLAHRAESAGAATAAAEKTVAEGKGIAQTSIWHGAEEFAKGLADLASWNFAGAAAHFAASGSFMEVAASVGSAVATLFSGGGSGGSRAGGGAGGSRSRSGSSRAAGAGGSSGATNQQSQINVYVQGGMISSDTLNNVVRQISQSVQNGQTTLPATHLIVGGAMVPAGASA